MLTLSRHAQAATNTMLAGIEMATRDTTANLLRVNSELATAGFTLRGVYNALLPVQDGVAALGPLLISKANETHTQLARMERSTASSILAYHGLVANAVQVADKRNAEFGRKLSVGNTPVPMLVAKLTWRLTVPREYAYSTSPVSAQRFEGVQ